MFEAAITCRAGSGVWGCGEGRDRRREVRSETTMPHSSRWRRPRPADACRERGDQSRQDRARDPGRGGLRGDRAARRVLLLADRGGDRLLALLHGRLDRILLPAGRGRHRRYPRRGAGDPERRCDRCGNERRRCDPRARGRSSDRIEAFKKIVAGYNRYEDLSRVGPPGMHHEPGLWTGPAEDRGSRVIHCP